MLLKHIGLIMAIFHEVKCGKSINYSRKHIKQKIKETKVLKGIHTKELPNSAKVYLILLKMHLYLMALIGAKVISKRRG